jgi:hypothetical protein
MSRILDGGEEFSIAPGATAVFGRAAAGGFDEVGRPSFTVFMASQRWCHTGAQFQIDLPRTP